MVAAAATATASLLLLHSSAIFSDRISNRIKYSLTTGLSTTKPPGYCEKVGSVKGPEIKLAQLVQLFNY